MKFKILALALFAGSCLAKLSTPIVNNGTFANPTDERGNAHILDALKLFFKTKTSFKKMWEYQNCSLDDWKSYQTPLARSKEPAIQWIGHASFLIQINNCNILTDPIFGNMSILYRRTLPPGIDPNDLPKIDAVIISHNHRDHMDEASLKLLRKDQPHMLVPQGTKDWFVKRGFRNVTEHTWWQGTTVAGVDFKFLPALHWCQRNATDTNKALWGGWMISAQDKNIYFAGDTGWFAKYFEEIKSQFSDIDFALLPIGPCTPRHIMQHSHMSAKEAVDAFIALGAKHFIPMHWGTFRLGPDCFEDPIQRLQKYWQEKVAHKTLDKCQLNILKFGQKIRVINEVVQIQQDKAHA